MTISNHVLQMVIDFVQYLCARCVCLVRFQCVELYHVCAFGGWQSRAQSGRTALIFAAENSHADCVRLLIDAGADTNAHTNVRIILFPAVSSNFFALCTIAPLCNVGLLTTSACRNGFVAVTEISFCIVLESFDDTCLQLGFSSVSMYRHLAHVVQRTFFQFRYAHFLTMSHKCCLVFACRC